MPPRQVLGARLVRRGHRRPHRVPSGRFPDLDEVPTVHDPFGAYTVAATADWDADGHADILFSSWFTSGKETGRARYRERIVWGGRAG